MAKKSKREIVDLIVDVVEEKYSTQNFESSLKDFSDEEVLGSGESANAGDAIRAAQRIALQKSSRNADGGRKTRTRFFQQIYGVALARKTDGIFEAVERGLINSPNDLEK